MPQILPGFPADMQHDFSVPLAGVRFTVRLTWRERTGSWYLDLYDADGDAVALGRRLSPGWSPLAGLSLPTGPTGGLLMCEGPDPYDRYDLGADLQLVWYEAAELEAADEDDGITVAVVLA